MKLPDRPSDTEVDDQVRAWLQSGNAVRKLKLRQSFCKPLTYDGINGPCQAEPEPSRGEPEPGERV